MLTQTLISAKISPEMWEVFDMIYDSLLQEGTIFFIGEWLVNIFRSNT